MCIVSIDDCEPFEFFTEVTRKARKAHICSACGGPIRKGSKYVVHSSKFDGELESSKCCHECDCCRGEFATHHEGIMPTPSNLKDMLIECVHDTDDPKKWKDMLAEMDRRKTL